MIKNNIFSNFIKSLQEKNSNIVAWTWKDSCFISTSSKYQRFHWKKNHQEYSDDPLSGKLIAFTIGLLDIEKKNCIIEIYECVRIKEYPIIFQPFIFDLTLKYYSTERISW